MKNSLYLHIPFCRQACHYCNFHFSTSLRHKDDLLAAMHREIGIQKDYFNTPTKPVLETVYFGGGTPSLLSADELNRFFDTINQHFDIVAGAEITLEANPDDLTSEYLQGLKRTPITRLSIGVQSFRDEDLRYMNRAHNATEALSTLKLAQDIGFHNLSLDLIYGTPGLHDEAWLANLDIAFGLAIHHLSSYALTLEPNTPLQKQVKLGKSPAPNDEQAARQFLLLMEATAANGFEHYEISNFCRPPHYARHNTAYWQNMPYLGIGPAAHSYNGLERQWNISNNGAYIKALANDELPSELEVLSIENRYNEYVMTSLRTIWGCSPVHIASFGERFLKYFNQEMPRFVNEGLVEYHDETYCLTRAGKLRADGIASDLFVNG